jgi:hypothetical protein
LGLLLDFGGFARYAFPGEYERNLEIKYSWGETYRTEQFNENPFSKYDYGISCGAGLKGLKARNIIVRQVSIVL